MNKKKVILDFIKKNKIGVISTVNPQNKPESAVVEFGETDNLELIFDAYSNSRKAKNIKLNTNVSFVIGWDKDITVQYEGKAVQLEGQELENYKKIYIQKNKNVKKWEKVKGIIFFKVVPSWIRYSDLNKDPWEVFEVNF